MPRLFFLTQILTFLVLVVFNLVILPQPNAHAQERDSNLSNPLLFNNKARDRAAQRLFEATKRKNLSIKRKQINYDGNPGSDLLPETADEVLYNTANTEQLMSSYRGVMYLSYLDDVTGLDALEDIQSTAHLAEKVFLFQTARSFTDYLSTSPLAPTYRRVISRLKDLRDYTTVKVTQEVQDKDLEVGLGRSAPKGKDLLQFRFHANARDGIEPRIEFGENTSLSYDIIEQETLLKYQINF